MIQWLKTVIDFILPPRCLLCNKVIHTDNSLCTECFDKISFIAKPYCKHCGKPLPYNHSPHELYCAECLSQKDFQLFMCRSAIKYDVFSKKLILDFKFSDHIENKSLLAQWLFFAGRDIFSYKPDVILPVPLHYSRLFQRKYNQSAVLACELSKLTNIPADYSILKKYRYTKPQTICNGKQRQKNIKDAFIVNDCAVVTGKHVVLIDDVYTTGATLTECAKVLKKSGAKKVSALTVARVLD